MPIQFETLTRQYFGHLLEGHGFILTKTDQDPSVTYNAYVQYESKHVGMRITLDRGQVLIDMGTLTWAPESWIDLSTIIEFLNPAFNGNVFVPVEELDQDHHSASQLHHLAQLVRDNTELVLEGNFQEWDRVKQFGLEKARKIYKQLTGEDLPDWA